jgi:hypothetical protein
VVIFLSIVPIIIEFQEQVASGRWRETEKG